MTPSTLYQPVILLLGKRTKRDEVDNWLAESRYSTFEATNVFHALEQISDFTVGQTPDVVFVHSEGMDAELEMLETMLASDGDYHGSVIAYSGNESPRLTNHDTSGLGALARQLDRLIPVGPNAN